MKNKKAQSAIEFMIIVAAVFLFFIVFLYAIQKNSAERMLWQRIDAMKEITLTLQSEIAIANDAGDGYNRNFNLPEKMLGGIDYNLSIIANSVYINTTKDALALPCLNVTGQPIFGNNSIRNVNGSVILN